MKTLAIALKDTRIAFRDRNALLLVIGAPLLIALVMGMAFGGQAADTSPISEIPVIVVNLDEGEFGDEFAGVLADIEVKTADGTKPLFLVTDMDDLDEAKGEIEQGNARGVVFLPADFSALLQTGTGEGAERPTAVVQVFTDPAATVSPGIVRGVVSRIATGFSTVVIGNVIAVDQVLAHVTRIPVMFVNEDTGPLAGAIDQAFAPENFEELFVLTVSTDLASASAALANGETEAVIHILDGFSQAVMRGGDGDALTGYLEILSDPHALGAPVVRDVALGIVQNFANGGEAAEVSSPIFDNLDDLADILSVETDSFGENEGARDRIQVSASSVGSGEGFNLLNYFVPSMAIFFLMFSTFGGTRSILEEERDGTLHRLMTTPTGRAEILLGKIGGTFMTGLLQFVILVLISGLVFGVDWGSEPVGMALMVLGTVAAATSLGALIAAFARNVNQAGVVGSAITLIFAILGGNFIDFRAIPDWLVPVSKATINRWALEGFFNLTLLGYELQQVWLNIAVLFGMAAVFFGLSILFFKRRFVG